MQSKNTMYITICITWHTQQSTPWIELETLKSRHTSSVQSNLRIMVGLVIVIEGVTLWMYQLSLYIIIGKWHQSLSIIKLLYDLWIMDTLRLVIFIEVVTLSLFGGGHSLEVVTLWRWSLFGGGHSLEVVTLWRWSLFGGGHSLEVVTL